MAKNFLYELLQDAREMSTYQGWDESVYRDFFAVQKGEMSQQDFYDKYRWCRAILSLDMTGFTTTAMNIGELPSLLRIVDAQKVCIPVLKEYRADLVRCFADDIVALFEDPGDAIDAAFELHKRVRDFCDSDIAPEHPTRCCIGIGFGDVFKIGPNLAQGDEMNRASKLGEDIARADETLLTERAHEALRQRADIGFEKQTSDDQLFPFYRAVPRETGQVE